MDSLLKGLFAEKSPTKVVGLFANRDQAEAAVARVLATPGIMTGQARLLGPPDAGISRQEIFGRNMEPEQRGIFHTLLLTHGITALAGAVVGLVVFAGLYLGDQPMVVASPLFALMAIVGFAVAFGLLLGGFLSIRPDHVWLINKVRDALRHNRWAVIVHPTDENQISAARQTLQQSGAEVLKSL